MKTSNGTWIATVLAVVIATSSTVILYKPARTRAKIVKARISRRVNNNQKGIVFFDMDDTLVPTTRSDATAYDIMRNVVYEELSRWGMEDINGERVTSEFAVLLREKPWDPNGVVPTDEWRSQLWQKAIAHATDNQIDDYNLGRLMYYKWKTERLRAFVPLPGVEEMLIDLRKDYCLALVTNGDSTVQHEKLKNWDGYVYFDAIVVSGDEPHPKPHTSIFTTALQRCGGEKMQDVVMVGDSLTADIAGAQAAGCGATVLVSLYDGEPYLPTQGPQPDHVINDLLQLSELLPSVFSSLPII